MLIIRIVKNKLIKESIKELIERQSDRSLNFHCVT